ncbi:MAG: acyl carrier protein [Candidatus Sericytochromatia bacterium]|nr:acyl carrier protein [Candidatus Sericytochromatia bacterium]
MTVETTTMALMRRYLADVAPWLQAETVSDTVSMSAEIGLDSLTMTSFAVALEKGLGKAVGIDLWMVDTAPDEQDTLANLAAWLDGQ